MAEAKKIGTWLDLLFQLVQLVLLFVLTSGVIVILIFVIPFLTIFLIFNMFMNGGQVRLYRNPKQQLLYDLKNTLRKKIF